MNNIERRRQNQHLKFFSFLFREFHTIFFIFFRESFI